MKKILPLVASSLLAFSLIACNDNKDTSVKAPEAGTSSVEVSDDLKSNEHNEPKKEETQNLLEKLFAALQTDETLQTAFGTVYENIGKAVAENEDLDDVVTEIIYFFENVEGVFKADTESASESVNFDLDEIPILEEEGVSAKIYNADVSLTASSEIDQKNKTQEVGVKGSVDASANLEVDLEKAAGKVAKDSVLKQLYVSATVSGDMDVNGTITLATDTVSNTDDSDIEDALAGTLNACADAGIAATFLVDNTAGILVVKGNAKINLDDDSVNAVEESSDLLEYLEGKLTFTIYDVNGTEIDTHSVLLKDFIASMMPNDDTGSDSDIE